MNSLDFLVLFAVVQIVVTVSGRGIFPRYARVPQSSTESTEPERARESPRKRKRERERESEREREREREKEGGREGGREGERDREANDDSQVEDVLQHSRWYMGIKAVCEKEQPTC